MRVLLSILVLTQFCFVGFSQTFSASDSSVFKYGKQKIILFKNTSDKKIILFKTNLAVNTDGVPYSYHPYDLRGDSIAINSITNGVYIYRLKDSINLCVPNKSKSSKVP